MKRVFIGYDTREHDAWLVCDSSVSRHSRSALPAPLRLDECWRAGLFERKFIRVGEQLIDYFTRQPFTTEFTFTRYLVPAIAGYSGWALFCDCDFLFRADVAEVFALADERYAVMVCKQAHQPEAGVKMEGQLQYRYARKNWSSFILWNCGHRANKRTVYRANCWPKDDLHAFSWLTDDLIGELPPAWNWIEGTTEGEPKAVHFTAGLPRMPGYENAAYADEWRRELERAESGKTR